MIQRNISLPSSRSNKPRKIPACKLATCFHSGILLSFFDPEDGRDMFPSNVG
jgi:hypothetical protein